MIEKIQVENFDSIQNILRKEFSCKFVSDDFSKCYAMFIENKIQGFIIYSLIYDRIELNYIYVNENSRNEGIASKLMEKMIEEANKNEVINITLEVNVHNEIAIKLYEKYGFIIGAIRKGYYQGEDGYLMIRE